MITPMTKLTMLIYHRDYQQFLVDLREQGIVHVHTKKKSFENEILKAKLAEFKRVYAMIKQLGKLKTSENKIKAEEKGVALLDFLENKYKSIETMQQRITSLKKDNAVYAQWGDFPEDTLNKIQSYNYWDVRFFTTPSKKYDPKWEEDFNAVLINETAGTKYFTTILPKNREIQLDADKYQFPTLSKSEINQEIELLSSKIENEKQYLKNVAESAIQQLDIYKKEVQNDTNFFKVSDAANKVANEKLLLLEGWTPIEIESQVVDWLKEQNIYFEATKPEKSKDNPPIKLKNNKFSTLFEFIGEMYSLPSYWELDLTPFFAPFFVLFFGLCLGDAGYGLLVVAVAITLLCIKKFKKMRPILWLGFFFGIGTIIMGTISGGFFGIQLLEVNNIPFVNKLKGIMFRESGWYSAFWFSFVIGGAQILFGMILKVINLTKTQGFPAAVSTIGWIILLVGGGLSYFLAGAGTIFYVFLILGLLLIFILNAPFKKIYSPLVNIGSGVWNTYNMITGLLGDLLSYVRLFALGLSGSILGIVFNDLSIQMSGNIPVLSQLIMVLILVFGHSINIALSALGAFVHPMRLTFVEFYKNAGFAGGGKKYVPFKKITNN